jgi:hypothetical protein
MSYASRKVIFPGGWSIITTAGVTGETLISYWDIVIKAVTIIDAGIVNNKTNKLCKRVKIHRVNFDRYVGQR